MSRVTIWFATPVSVSAGINCAAGATETCRAPSSPLIVTRSRTSGQSGRYRVPAACCHVCYDGRRAPVFLPHSRVNHPVVTPSVEQMAARTSAPVAIAPQQQLPQYDDPTTTSGVCEQRPTATGKEPGRPADAQPTHRFARPKKNGTAGIPRPQRRTGTMRPRYHW